MRLLFSPEAEQDIERIDSWWRENRQKAPDLFAQELAKACEDIQRRPLILKPYTERRGVVIRRWLLKKTEQHVYYEADIKQDAITVLRV